MGSDPAVGYLQIKYSVPPQKSRIGWRGKLRTGICARLTQAQHGGPFASAFSLRLPWRSIVAPNADRPALLQHLDQSRVAVLSSGEHLPVDIALTGDAPETIPDGFRRGQPRRKFLCRQAAQAMSQCLLSWWVLRIHSHGEREFRCRVGEKPLGVIEIVD